jgi:hypothetical protein
MSWSVTMIGKPKNIVTALAKEGASLEGQSKIEFDAAFPSLSNLVLENFSVDGSGYLEPVLLLEASGSGFARGEEQMHRSLSVKLTSMYGRIV